MDAEWSLRDYFYKITQRWYLVAAFFLVGALIGWLASQFWPPLYRAHMDLYLGINAYRGPRDRYIVNVAQDELSSLDDYKNWQMEQVGILAYQDDFLAETLDRLQAQDDFWQDYSTDYLYYNLHNSWRNAGRWHLTAEVPQREQSIQAVRTWAEVITERINSALEHSRQVVGLDISMVATADKLTELNVRLQALSQAKVDIEAALINLDDSAPDQPWGPFDRQHLLSQVSQAADWNPSWQALLETYPASDALPTEYQLWIENALAVIENELADLPDQIAELDQEYQSLAEQYAEETTQSMALSANLTLELSSGTPIEIERVNPTSNLMVIGGVLGILLYLVVALVQISGRQTEE